MNVTVIGTTDVDYTTAWHYAAALENLGYEVQRLAVRYPWVEVLSVRGIAAVHVGRLAGLPRLPMPPAKVLFTDDGVWAAANGAHYLRSGCHGPEAHDSEPYPPWEPRWDVCFVGSSPGHPEWPHRAELIAHLRDWFGERFLHVGPGGVAIEDDSRKFWGQDIPLRGHWLNRTLRSVPITIGDSVFHDPNLPYWSERCYEVWARGGFLIHPRNELLMDELGPLPGAKWDVGDWDALREEIDFHLAYPEVREATRVRLQEIVRTHCTYEHRAQELLATLGA